MEAGEIQSVLQARAAYLPGSRDRDGRPLIIVSIPTELQPWTKDNLDLTLRYISSTFTSGTRRNGLTVIVDAQRGAWRVTRGCIRHIGLSLGPDLYNLIIIKPDVFWDKQRMDNCTKTQKEGEPIYIPITRLTKYVDNAHLPEDLGGTWTYNHAQWIQNRLFIESFMKDMKKTITDLESFHARLVQFVSGTRTSTSSDSFVFSKQAFDSNKIFAQKVLQAGRELLNQIEKTDNECRQNSPVEYVTPQDILDTKNKLQNLMEIIEQKQNSIDVSWIEMEKKFHDAREIAILENGVSRVTNWILNTAETLLNTQQEVGYDVQSSEELRSKHETFELQCRETYGHYAELLHKIDTLPKLNIQIPNDLKSQRDFMDFVCRSFATRLERRRNILITCVRFYRLVTEYFGKTSEVFETLVMCTDIDSLESADCSLHELQESQTNIDFLAKELVKEGEKLSDMLSMPVKDALGRDIEVNYESDIVNVQEILQASMSRSRLFSDSVDLQKLTLEQVTHIHAYEKDAAQAIQWLKDLFQVLQKEHIHVGCNVHEIQLMKEEHQTFQETAKGTYDYGCQLLQAALALRHSCKLPDETNKPLTQDLLQVFSKLQSVEQEQMTRLRVSAVFHRSVEEHCKQLRELTASVQALSKIEDQSKRKSRLRKFLHCRERLLLEVGRMVRLGRLLRSRLKEPVFPDHESHNEAAVDAISEKLTDVTALAEQLDATLCGAQADGVAATVGNNIKKILDGTASTTPEDWYTSIKPGRTKTSNTSSDSKSEDEFITASECTCTPPSRSSSFHTASEGGAISPWWEVDPTSDSDEKHKLHCIQKQRSPTRISNQMAEIVVLEETEITNLKMSANPSLGITSYLLEKSQDLLRPDMITAQTNNLSSFDAQESSKTDEIVRKLTEIVQSNVSYAPSTADESSPTEIHKYPSEYRYDGDTSSQYSSELLNTNLECLAHHSHSKSLSYDTDKTDSSLPRFSSQPPRTETRYESPVKRYNNDDNIYIIDASTPSPKSKRYMETSFDYQEPTVRVVEVEVYQTEADKKKEEEELLNDMGEVRTTTTIDLQGACALPTQDYYYPAQITRLAIKGIF